MTALRHEERWAQACIQLALPDAQVKPHDDSGDGFMWSPGKGRARFVKVEPADD
jgi:hypothetical protein